MEGGRRAGWHNRVHTFFCCDGGTASSARLGFVSLMIRQHVSCRGETAEKSFHFYLGANTPSGISTRSLPCARTGSRLTDPSDVRHHCRPTPCPTRKIVPLSVGQQ